jgi:putative resolvase
MNNKELYVGGKKACEILGVHQQTLYNWDKKKLIDVIRTPGGKRLYNVNKYLEENKIKAPVKVENEKKQKKLCYIRVSTVGQKDDLERQKKYMKDKYPNYEIIEDIGSGINFNRRGIRKIIRMAIAGEVAELVVAYKDRLTRFGYELIEDLITEYSNGKIIIENKKEIEDEKEEIVEDVLQILNVYVAKMNGLRKYKKEPDKQIKIGK